MFNLGVTGAFIKVVATSGNLLRRAARLILDAALGPDSPVVKTDLNLLQFG